MTWTDGKPFVVAQEHLKARWGLEGHAMRCCLCGHTFVMGDTARWQFTNDTPGAGGNPFVCMPCDTGREAIIAEILRRRAELKADKWWWFLPKGALK
jgi:hypothetical protein